MSTTAQYLMLGTAALVFFVAWPFYIRKVGGFLEYVNHPWESIAVFAVAALVGWGAFHLALSMMTYPSEEQIRKTPSWKETEDFYRTGEAPDDNKTYDDSVGVIKDDEGETTPADPEGVRRYNPLDARKDGKRRVVMDASQVWREKLVAERNNARLLAKQIAIAAGLFASGVGFGIMGLRRAKLNAERAALAAAAAAAAPPTPLPPPPAPVASAPEPPREPVMPVDDTPVVTDESGDAPVNIDDLDRDYKQYLKDKEGGR